MRGSSPRMTAVLPSKAESLRQTRNEKDADGRDKPGHDEKTFSDAD